MGFWASVKTCMSNYAQFGGRAARREFWFFVLFLALVQFVGLNLTAKQPEGSFKIHFGVYFYLGPQYPWFFNLYTGLFAIPFFAALSRRLHDVGVAASTIFVVPFALFAIVMFALKALPDLQQLQSGIGFAAAMIPLVLFLIFTSKKSQPGENKYGPNPHEASK